MGEGSSRMRTKHQVRIGKRIHNCSIRRIRGNKLTKRKGVSGRKPKGKTQSAEVLNPQVSVATLHLPTLLTERSAPGTVYLWRTCLSGPGEKGWCRDSVIKEACKESSEGGSLGCTGMGREPKGARLGTHWAAGSPRLRLLLPDVSWSRAADSVADTTRQRAGESLSQHGFVSCMNSHWLATYAL